MDCPSFSLSNASMGMTMYNSLLLVLFNSFCVFFHFLAVNLHSRDYFDRLEIRLSPTRPIQNDPSGTSLYFVAYPNYSCHNDNSLNCTICPFQIIQPIILYKSFESTCRGFFSFKKFLLYCLQKQISNFMEDCL